jgi:hypothetical protein
LRSCPWVGNDRAVIGESDVSISGGILATNRRASILVVNKAPPPMSRPSQYLILYLGFHAIGFAADAATSNHALFRSADRGRTWAQSDTGLPVAERINALAASPIRHFAGTDAGVFVSDESGASWRNATLIPGRSRRVLCLCVLGKILYAGTDGGGIVASTDDGASWERLDEGRDALKVRSLMQTGGILYAGLDAGGVLRSSNNGKTWESVSEGIPAGVQVFNLANLGGKVFASLYTKGLYGLGPNGRWIRTGEVVPLTLASVGENLIAGHNPGGIFWSSDLGQTWRTATGDLPPNAPVWAEAGDRELVIAGVADGIYLSCDRGRFWSRAEGGLPPVCPGIAFLVGESLILAAAIVGE